MASNKADFVTGDGRILNVKHIADIYRNVVNISVPSSGKIQKLAEDNFALTCKFKTTDCDCLEFIETSKVWSLSTASSNSDRQIQSVRCITEPHTIGELAAVGSDNGRFMARLKSPSSGRGNDSSNEKQLLEIWERSKLLKTIDISEVEVHGPICTDQVFSSFSWSPYGDQDKLVYVCQRKRCKYQSFFKQPFIKIEETEGRTKGKAPNLGGDNVRVEDWGECLKGIDHTIVAVLDVSNDCEISTVDLDGWSLADTKWIDGTGTKTISVAYPERPRLLGLIYCNNRPSKLVIHDWSQSSATEVLSLSSDTLGFYSPRISNCGKRILYLSSKTWGAHMHSVNLRLYNLDTGEDRLLMDAQTNQTDFFITKLENNCFSQDDSHIIFVENDHLFSHMCLFSLVHNKKTRIKFPTTGLTLLDFRHDIILATGSELNATPTLFVSVLCPVDPGELVAWHQIEDCIHLDEIEYENYKIPTADKDSFVSAILTTPSISLLHSNFHIDSTQRYSTKPAKNSYDLPTVVFIHGGPHTAILNSYMPSIVFYARMGLRSLIINYRGSTGVSEDYVTCLSGRTGELDVADCLLIIRFFVTNNIINPSKLVVQGGSHGGFLSCHLSCQQEFKFTSAIIRNPVVDLASTVTTTDIPDWAYSVALGQETFDFSAMPSTQDYVKMYEMSPMSRHSQAYVPTLMLLGSKDFRVKMYQGERWIELLKAKGIDTLCKVYADKHALGKVETACDANLTSMIWILEHLPEQDTA